MPSLPRVEKFCFSVFDNYLLGSMIIQSIVSTVLSSVGTFHSAAIGLDHVVLGCVHTGSDRFGFIWIESTLARFA